MSDFTLAFQDRRKHINDATRIWEVVTSASSQPTAQDIPFTQNLVLRRVTIRQAQFLEEICRCRCSDWNKVFFLQQPSQEIGNSLLRRLLSDSNFDGHIVLAIVEDSIEGNSHWHRLPPGIHNNALISESIFEIGSCRVYRNSYMSNTFVKSGAVVMNCGQIAASHGFTFGELSISVGPESGGGRDLKLAAEDSMIEVCKQLRNGPNRSYAQQHHQQSMNIIGRMCIVRDTPTIKDICLHDESSIEGAASVSGSTLFPGACIKDASTASNVLLQWNTSISASSSVSDTLLMEQAHCGPNSIVASSVLGPDVHVSAGEIHASVIGPNTNAHHQSLLIGILWPLGRGNVGYGANVGSNHTGRLPDQETIAGEGTFWGLSNVIKFPVDLTYAPYSIVAAGTTLPSQRVCLPFSLIVGQPSGNEIIPGWVLQSSPYTLVRSEKKFATRRKAKRHLHYTGWRIFRPETMALCRWAKLALEANLDAQKVAIGANKLTDRARSVGIRAYTETIQRYALQGLLSYVLELTNTCQFPMDINALEAELRGSSPQDLVVLDPLKATWPIHPWDDVAADPWTFQKSLLIECFPVDGSLTSWLEESLNKLVALENDLARRILKCKKRDDDRGQQSIPGYAQAHVEAERDPVILAASSTAKKTDDLVVDILASLRKARSKL